jgi:pimeloyl-ACP methyl ester carboxylesterase
MALCLLPRPLAAAVLVVAALMLAALVTVSACVPPQGEEPPHGDADAGPEVEEPVLIEPGCTDHGCLQALTVIGDYSLADVERWLSPGVAIDNGYSVFTLQYATDGRASTATVNVPFGVEPPEGGFPVVVNAHGTVGLEDPCRVSNTVSGAGLAGLFGARGAIGIAPDYPGLGTEGLHAYLSKEEEGKSVLDAIRAAKRLARYLDVPTNGRAAVVGLSQGGHAVLSAAALHASYAPELDVRAFGATAPASVYEEHWRGGAAVAGPHQPYFALVAWDWAELAGAPQDFWSAERADDIDTLMRTRCLWSPSFTDELLLGEALGEDPAQIFTAPFLEAFSTGQWGPWTFMAQAFADNRVVPFEQTAPIRIWQGSADTVVLPAMTHGLVDNLNAAGMDVELVEVPGGTHINTAFGFVASAELATEDSVAWILGHLD